jgi:hypothetical protein
MGCLFHGDVCDLEVRVLVVPLGGDAVEGEAERFRLAGAQRSYVEIHRFVVGSVVPEKA